jgi:hypothetical protein
LQIDADGLVRVSNPETDPFNLAPENKGIIQGADDRDLFALSVGEGPLDLTVTPAWDAFYRDSRRGANLDIAVTLRNAAGAVVASADPASDTFAEIATSVPAGTYYLKVNGVGSAN